LRLAAADTHLRGFLFAVARNLWRSHLRWSWVDGTKLVELALGPAPISRSPHAELAASELEARFESAVLALPAPQREVLLLVVLEHLEPSEIAHAARAHRRSGASAPRSRSRRVAHRPARSRARRRRRMIHLPNETCRRAPRDRVLRRAQRELRREVVLKDAPVTRVLARLETGTLTVLSACMLVWAGVVVWGAMLG
jgi:hypothetical protein